MLDGTNRKYDLSDPAQYDAWLKAVTAEIRTPEYVAAERAAAKRAHLQGMVESYKRMKNPDPNPIDTSIGTGMGTYSWIRARGD